MSYEIEWEPGGVYVRLRGKMSGRDYQRLVAELANDPRIQKRRYELYEYERDTEIVVTHEELLALKEEVARLAAKYRGVVVATVDTGKLARRFVGRILNNQVSPYPMESFLSVESARRWIARQLG
jgi:hypothetical protein